MNKITEKDLLDGYQGITYGLDYYSIINGKTYYWSYRVVRDDSQPVTDRENASILSTHCGLTISIDTECDDHPTLKRLEDDFEKATHA